MMHQFIEFAESVKALAATTTNLTPEQINALSVLDPEFKENAEKLYNVFSVLFTTPAIVEEAAEMVAETESGPEPTKKTAKKKTSKKKRTLKQKEYEIPEGFYRHPVYEEIIANKEGTVLTSGKPISVCCSTGYPQFSSKGKRLMVSRIVYECCTGAVIPKGMFINYKNTIKSDVRFENLTISKNHVNGARLEDYTVAKVSEKIVEYTQEGLATYKIPGKIASELNVSVHGVQSILSGNYSAISGKYFYVGPEKKIVVVQKQSETKKQAIIDPCQAVLEKGLEAGIECFDTKFLSGEKITNGDLIVPIVRFMYNDDGSMTSSATIKDKIRNEYGSDVVPSDKLIMDVKEKRLGKAVIEAALKK
jgi:hypothetical protein